MSSQASLIGLRNHVSYGSSKAAVDNMTVEIPEPMILAKLDELMHTHGLESPYAEWLKNWERDELEDRLTTFVPCGDYFPLRDHALRAHASQIDPDGPWFAVPLAIQQAGWPTEDYQLAKSMVPVTLPEDDLFAGIPTTCADKLDEWYYTI